MELKGWKARCAHASQTLRGPASKGLRPLVEVVMNLGSPAIGSDGSTVGAPNSTGALHHGGLHRPIELHLGACFGRKAGCEGQHDHPRA